MAHSAGSDEYLRNKELAFFETPAHIHRGNDEPLILDGVCCHTTSQGLLDACLNRGALTIDHVLIYPP